MAQLSDDCFAGGTPPTLDAARALIEAQVGPVDGTEQVGLRDADGRVLAADVAAPTDLPPFDNAAVDGYAVRLAGLEAGGTCRWGPAHGGRAGSAFGGGFRMAHLHRRCLAARRRRGVHAGECAA
jgi:molybdopterin molybdotransferase